MKLTFLNRCHLVWIWSRTAWPEYRRWKRPRRLSEMRPRVFYGFDEVAGPGDLAFGGLVKVQDLNGFFPNQPEGANLLYLVSSALPHFAVRMASLAKRSGSLLVVNQNGVAYPAWFGPGWQRYNRAMKHLHRMADHVFYQSAFCRLSAERFLGRRIGPSEILFNPVDTKVFAPAKKTAAVEKDLRLLLAGSHWSFYRVETAVRALALVRETFPNTRLLIAGRFCWDRDEGRAERRLLELADSLGVKEQVRLLGSYTQRQAVPLLQRADILLHTKYNDPCPRLVVEAMACGLPVVYSASGGVPELVGKNAGIGVPAPLDWEKDHPPDPRELAIAVRKVAADLTGYAQAARRRATANLDVRPWLQRHGEVFWDLLKNRQHPS